MTRTLTLAAFVFTLVALPAWSSARACGGYGDFAPDPQTVEIESAVRSHFASYREHVRIIVVQRLSLVEASGRTPAHNVVRVQYARGTTRFVQMLRVSNQRGSWRVVGGERPLRA